MSASGHAARHWAAADGAARGDRNSARLRQARFTVLDWNPARAFYHRLGIEARAEWLPYRSTDDALRQLAAQDEGDGD